MGHGSLPSVEEQAQPIGGAAQALRRCTHPRPGESRSKLRSEVRREASMPHEIHHRDEVQALMDRGAQLVEVLGREEFEEDHLPGAINLPLRRIESEAKARLDPSRPVVVYCWDSA